MNLILVLSIGIGLGLALGTLPLNFYTDQVLVGAQNLFEKQSQTYAQILHLVKYRNVPTYINLIDIGIFFFITLMEIRLGVGLLAVVGGVMTKGIQKLEQ